MYKSDNCPICGHTTYKIKCKIICPIHNIIWDCSDYSDISYLFPRK